MDFWLNKQAQQNGQHIAITDGQVSYTYRDLYLKAHRLATKLKIYQQSRVGLYIDNSIQSVVLIHACWLANIEIAMINTRLTPNEMTNQMRSIDVQLIFCTLPLELRGFQIVSLDDNEFEGTDITMNGLLGNTMDVQYDTSNETVVPKDSPPNILNTFFNLDDIASIMFTSGTTGPQKAVPQTFRNHYASAIGCKDSLGYNHDTNWLSVLPIYHISGLSVILRAVIEGFTVRIVDKFNAEQILTIIKNERITHISLVPQTLNWLMHQGLHEPYDLQKILLGGAKLSATMIETALQYNLPIYNSFGMTETCSQFLTATPEMLHARPDTVGMPSANVDVKIKNPNKEGHGELMIKGANVMNGYLYPSDLTDTFENGYFNTGDIAEIDHEGYVMIYDRRKDLIISGGENIYPYQIETVAKQFPGISDAVCVGHPDDTWGQVPKLYFISESDISKAQLIAYLSQHLAKYKVPKHFEKVDTLPYTSTGKLQRNKLYRG
ncbi:o-succinylbenzoate--CoA ligase [Staphylococcus schweitzeri]|uniref:2-succinylbenzoate--CoA ligase n=1 Tax=Staphylococcus schweitzeri TaxID=1654388 RepID=A0A077UM84_9STAP|nr:o-succinylbenzoate--CoA ligase [Staphylococcus schweitzeri]CDR28287.1 O-succinylbenzoic acid--CoA ligase [Staphylococcus schweitzeri]